VAATADDIAELTALLGRPPQAEFEVVVRTPAGRPAVIRNAPLLDDGTPMPTRYWLVDPDLVLAVSRLEATAAYRSRGRRRPRRARRYARRVRRRATPRCRPTTAGLGLTEAWVGRAPA
jgi:hypothetical protein